MRENGTRYWHRTNSILRLYYALIQRRDDDLPFIEESLWLTREIRSNGPDFRTGYARNSGIQRMLTFRNERQECALGYTHRPRVGIRWTPSWVSMSPISDRKGPPPNIWETSRQWVNILWRLLAGILTIQSNCLNCSTSDRSVAQLFTDAISEATRNFFRDSPQRTRGGMRYGTPMWPRNILEQRPEMRKLVACLAERRIRWYPKRPVIIPISFGMIDHERQTVAYTHRIGYWS